MKQKIFLFLKQKMKNQILSKETLIAFWMKKTDIMILNWIKKRFICLAITELLDKKYILSFGLLNFMSFKEEKV